MTTGTIELGTEKNTHEASYLQIAISYHHSQIDTTFSEEERQDFWRNELRKYNIKNDFSDAEIDNLHKKYLSQVSQLFQSPKNISKLQEKASTFVVSLLDLDPTIEQLLLRPENEFLRSHVVQKIMKNLSSDDNSTQMTMQRLYLEQGDTWDTFFSKISQNSFGENHKLLEEREEDIGDLHIAVTDETLIALAKSISTDECFYYGVDFGGDDMRKLLHEQTGNKAFLQLSDRELQPYPLKAIKIYNATDEGMAEIRKGHEKNESLMKGVLGEEKYNRMEEERKFWAGLDTDSQKKLQSFKLTNEEFLGRADEELLTRFQKENKGVPGIEYLDSSEKIRELQTIMMVDKAL